VVTLFGEPLGHHMKQPEHHDYDDRNDDQNNDGDDVGGSVERLTRQERCAG
jgi:hypothetical protein